MSRTVSSRTLSFSSSSLILILLIIMQYNLPYARALPQLGVPAAAEEGDYHSDEDNTAPKQDTQPHQTAVQVEAEQPMYYREPQQRYEYRPVERYEYRPGEQPRWGK